MAGLRRIVRFKMQSAAKLYTSLLCAGLASSQTLNIPAVWRYFFGRAFVRSSLRAGLGRKQRSRRDGTQGALIRFALPSMAHGSGSALYATGTLKIQSTANVTTGKSF